MKTYVCDDGDQPVEIEADSPLEAAQWYVDSSGDWGTIRETIRETIWIKIWVRARAKGARAKRVTIALDPEEPRCPGPARPDQMEEHDWLSPWDLVGGCEGNPGIWGHGAGIIIHEICAGCGVQREIDTGATDPRDGTQGLRSITYSPRAPR